MNFQNYLENKLYTIIENNNLDINLTVTDEQQYVHDIKEPNMQYLVYRRMRGTLSYGVNTQPYQLLLMCEEDKLVLGKKLLDLFAEENNYTVNYTGNEFTKFVYAKPVVLSNFNEFDAGYRSIIYLDATLLILENVMMLKSANNNLNQITIDNEEIKCIGFNMNYNMTPDTQQTSLQELSKSVKSASSFSISFQMTLLSGTFLTNILNIIKGYSSGNTSFNVSFYIGDILFTYSEMKLLNAQLTDTPDQAPGIQIGLMV